MARRRSAAGDGDFIAGLECGCGFLVDASWVLLHHFAFRSPAQPSLGQPGWYWNCPKCRSTHLLPFEEVPPSVQEVWRERPRHGGGPHRHDPR